jgi:hypothetical protein
MAALGAEESSDAQPHMVGSSTPTDLLRWIPSVRLAPPRRVSSSRLLTGYSSGVGRSWAARSLKEGAGLAPFDRAATTPSTFFERAARASYWIA